MEGHSVDYHGLVFVEQGGAVKYYTLRLDYTGS
jgi:hypothetical protein